MITIKPYNDWNNGFHIEGHAMYAPHGNDIVCSAVSVLAQTIAHELTEYVYGTLIIESGRVEMKIDRWEYPTQTNALLDALRNGLTRIAEQYPQYVQIKEEK